MSRRSKRKRGRPRKEGPAPLPPPMEREEIDKAPQSPSLIEHALAENGQTARADIKIIETAVINRWGVSHKLKRKAVRKMGQLLDGDDKSALGAARVLTAMDRNDIQREALEKKQDSGTQVNVNITLEATKQQTELAALTAELRASQVVDAVSFGPASSDSGAIGAAGETGSDGRDGN